MIPLLLSQKRTALSFLNYLRQSRSSSRLGFFGKARIAKHLTCVTGSFSASGFVTCQRKIGMSPFLQSRNVPFPYVTIVVR